jgi:hypothetical protein
MAEQQWTTRTITFSGLTYGEADAKFGEWLLAQTAGRIRNVRRPGTDPSWCSPKKRKRQLAEPSATDSHSIHSIFVEYEMLVDASAESSEDSATGGSVVLCERLSPGVPASADTACDSTPLPRALI